MKTLAIFIITSLLITVGAHAQHLIVGDGSAVMLRNGAYMSVDILKVSNGGIVRVDESSLLRSSTSGVTDVPEHESQSDIPNAFALLQNYPNPFNPTTVISFQLPVSGYTTLKIYTSLGQEIATLVSANLSPGAYKATWDAAGYPSGVYFYRITTGEHTQTRKLILTK